MRKNSHITVIDQFCGAGGSSQGARRLGLDVQMAMNHWDLAVETHNTNFPETKHDCSDISAVDPRRFWPTDILITSPECTNHTVAKGAKRAQAQRSLFDKKLPDAAATRSRATMWDVVRFTEAHGYNIVIVENVVDARKWRLWDSWIVAMQSLGYEYKTVYLNSMFAHLDPAKVKSIDDFAPQSRDRMYVVFWKRGNKKPDLDFRPKAFCQACDKSVDAVQSFKKSPGKPYWYWGRYKAQYFYSCPDCAKKVEPFHFAAANAIDWTLPAERIGDRARPLKPKTLARIKKGLTRFAGQHLTIEVAYSHASDNRHQPLIAPLRSLTTRQSTGLLFLPFILGYMNQKAPARDVADVLRTFHTENGQGMVLPPFLNVHYSPGYNKSLDEPLAAHTAVDHHSLTIPAVASLRAVDGKKNGISYAVKPIDDALQTQVTSTQQALMYLPFIDRAATTFTAGGNHHGLAQMPFVMAAGGRQLNGRARGIVEVLGTQTGTETYSLVTPEQTPDVEDCLFRMLQPNEIGRGMAFDDDYIVLGTKRDKVKQYGNAVTPPAMLRLLERCVDSLR